MISGPANDEGESGEGEIVVWARDGGGGGGVPLGGGVGVEDWGRVRPGRWEERQRMGDEEK